MTKKDSGWEDPSDSALTGCWESTGQMRRSVQIARAFSSLRGDRSGAGSLAGEIWNEFLPTDGRALIEKMYQRAMSEVREMDLATARGHLLEIVKRETTRIEQSLDATRHGRSWRRKWPHIDRRSTTPERG